MKAQKKLFVISASVFILTFFFIVTQLSSRLSSDDSTMNFLTNQTDTSNTLFLKHYNSGIEFYKAQKYEQALVALKEAIQLNPEFEKAYNRIIAIFTIQKKLDAGKSYFKELIQRYPTNSFAYFGLGSIWFNLKEYQKAIEFFQKSIQLQPQFVSVYQRLVDAYLRTDQLEKGIEWLSEFRRLQPNNPFAYYGLASAFERQADWDNVFHNIQKALDLNPQFTELYILQIRCLFKSGKPQEALKIGQQALSLLKTKEEPELQAAIYNNIGSIYTATGKFVEAIDTLKKGLALYEQSGDLLGQAFILGNLGDAFLAKASYDTAMIYHLQALEIVQKFGDQLAEAENLGAIAANYSYRGEYAKAFQFGQQALSLYQELGHKQGEAKELANFGVLHYEQGELTKALEYWNEALVLSKILCDVLHQITLLQNLGLIYTDLGDLPKALNFYEQALALIKKTEDKDSEAICYLNLGAIEWASGHREAFLSYMKNALKLFKATFNKRGQSMACSNLAFAYIESEEFRKAAEYFEQALEIAREIGNQFGEAETLNQLGVLYMKLNEFARAIECHEKALAISNKIGAIKIGWDAKSGLGQTYEKQGNYPQAIAFYKQAVDDIESTRAELLLAEQKSGFFENKILIYQRLVHLLYQLNQKQPGKHFEKQAFHFAERAKARALMDLLGEADVDINDDLDSTLAAQEKQVLKNISAINTKLRQTDLTPGHRDSLQQLLAQETATLQDLKFEIKRNHPAYAEITYPTPLTLTQVQTGILEKEQILLEYTLGEEKSYLWIIRVDSNNIFQLPAEKEIREKVSKYLAELSQPPQAENQTANLGREIFELLLKPAWPVIEKGTQLIIVPDGFLHYLPFETLVTGNHQKEPVFLAQNFDVTYAPSASVLGLIKNRLSEDSTQTVQELLAFGNPLFVKNIQTALMADSTDDVILRNAYRQSGFKLDPLPNSATEVEKISALFPANQYAVYVHTAATEEQLKTMNLQRFRKIHFATHALIEEEQPARSCIVLSLDDDPEEDGFLQTNEIFNLKLNADLVVLSACQTGRGKLMHGEGIIGLSRAFFYAGAKSLVVTLWAVNDESTARFMEKFYQFMAAGNSQSRALKLAKEAFIQSRVRRLRHPFYWAPFVLQGDWE